jgi:hypothetical protein
MIGVRFPAEAGNFSLRHLVQTGSGAHPASYPMGTRGSFPGGKAVSAWSWPMTSIYCRGQRMRGAILPLPQYVPMAWCLVEHRDNFTFIFLEDGEQFLNRRNTTPHMSVSISSVLRNTSNKFRSFHGGSVSSDAVQCCGRIPTFQGKNMLLKC